MVVHNISLISTKQIKITSLQSSNIWTKVQKCCLKTNIKLQVAGDTSVCEFRENIFKSGNFHTTTDFEGLTQPANTGRPVCPVIINHYMAPIW
jgi:uncharacterized protein YbcV (DUF1398 family)